MPSDSNNQPKNILTWVDIVQAVTDLAVTMDSYGFRPERIVAVARGGLIPATLLAHRFGVRDIFSVGVASYDAGHVRSDVKAITGFGEVQYYDNPVSLIVDDLWDTGNTHEHLRMLFPKATTATLFHKDRGDNAHRVVSFPGQSLDPDRWVVFPWELQ